jgi:hypothetical protein
MGSTDGTALFPAHGLHLSSTSVGRNNLLTLSFGKALTLRKLRRAMTGRINHEDA